MISQNLEIKLEALIASLGYVLYDLDLLREDTELIFRIYLSNFRSNGEKKSITLEDCTSVSEVISPFLDVEFELKEGYSLEVSSCGLERTLKKQRHYEHSLGDEVEVVLKSMPEEKKSKIRGVLSGYDGQSVELDSKTRVLLSEIKKIRTILKWIR